MNIDDLTLGQIKEIGNLFVAAENVMKPLALMFIAANFALAATDDNWFGSTGWLAAGLFAVSLYMFEREVGNRIKQRVIT